MKRRILQELFPVFSHSRGIFPWQRRQNLIPAKEMIIIDSALVLEQLISNRSPGEETPFIVERSPGVSTFFAADLNIPAPEKIRRSFKAPKKLGGAEFAVPLKQPAWGRGALEKKQHEQEP